ncbi:MAG: NAD(P)/FAD-dependent oxidoreductase [Planctomycetota bacterium]
MIKRLRQNKARDDVYEALVVGGGAAGLGVAIALKHAGLTHFAVLERQTVGASFAAWPRETRFITPSFATNSIGMLDLNSIAIGVSPAYSLDVEHPTGRDYAAHLRGVAKHFELPVREQTDVLRITKRRKYFIVETSDQTLRARHVVWAAGEYQYPRLNGFVGSEYCRHSATIPSYQTLSGDDFIVIGGYESGIDAAYHLADQGKRVRLFDRGCPWKEETSDPSILLSTYSIERMREDHFKQNVELIPHTAVDCVSMTETGFLVTTSDGDVFDTQAPPILAGGFEGSHKLVAELFEAREEDGFPLLSEDDESTRVPGLFLCGPAVRHGNHIFCFIYKYRQRFAVVAKAIADSLGLPAEGLEHYRKWGMYLDDLSCCGEECVC